MAFASTYYLVAMGVVLFVAKQPLIAPEVAAAMGALVAAMMGVYGYYLGHRRDVENEEVPQLSSGMLRCPFVMGILGRQVSSPQSVEAELAFQKNGIKG